MYSNGNSECFGCHLWDFRMNAISNSVHVELIVSLTPDSESLDLTLLDYLWQEGEQRHVTETVLHSLTHSHPFHPPVPNSLGKLKTHI
jgi:hypothetical protein